MAMRFAGTSFTFANPGYSGLSQTALNAIGLYDFTFSNQAVGGNNSFSNLIRLTTGDDVFIIDHANDSDAQWQSATLEAIIRKVWTAKAQTRIIIVGSPHWGLETTLENADVSTPSNLDAINAVKALATHYGIDYVDYLQWCIDNVPSVYDLTDLTPDKVHPSSIGYQAISTLLLDYLPLGGTEKPASLPAAYLYDTNGVMSSNTATRRLGNDNDDEDDEDGNGGNWSTVATTGRQSSTAGDTIRFNNVTGSIVGVYRADAVNMTVEISVDGGAFYSFLLYQNGQPLNEGHGTHDIVIRVVSGTVRIDEFWAI